MHRDKIYTRRIERVRNRWQYTVTLSLGGNNKRDVVVTEAIYNLIGELDRQDRHLSHQDERHNEFNTLSDESIYNRAFVRPEPMADAVIDRLIVEEALIAIKALPHIQARRFVLRNILGLTYPEIARHEGCSARAVKDSCDLATKKIRKNLSL
jgi:RNA polymerase sigma-70 factor (ECF subfamily)